MSNQAQEIKREQSEFPNSDSGSSSFTNSSSSSSLGESPSYYNLTHEQVEKTGNFNKLSFWDRYKFRITGTLGFVAAFGASLGIEYGVTGGLSDFSFKLPSLKNADGVAEGFRDALGNGVVIYGALLLAVLYLAYQEHKSCKEREAGLHNPKGGEQLGSFGPASGNSAVGG